MPKERYFSKIFFLFVNDFGRKPRNTNLSVGRPLIDRADINVLGPGILCIGYPNSLNCLTNLKPGSLISGVPLSDMSAKSKP